ncbi:MAG TPA: FtsX-like permease family protein [Chthoniobacterales bacterium]|nr:FtsX-like permease family protein [Chthoniobacterales bacterium]
MHSSFVGKMAWRDSRSSRRRLLLFSTSITLGISALVGIGSFRQSLAHAIDEQARTLIGADLIVESSRPFTPAEEAFLHSLGEPQAREVRFSTMAVFPRSRSTRLVQVRALGGDFPYYGKLETDPPSAARDFRNGPLLLADESLLLQFKARRDDPVKLGDLECKVAGSLKKIPGEASAAASFAPRVYLPLQHLSDTHLLKPGSVAHYRNYVKFPAGVNPDLRIAALVPQLQKFGLEYETVAKRKRDLGGALENLYRFLNLIGFVALLLGALGVASAIHAHLQQKIRTGAVLRCLGSSALDITSIYLLQAAAMGMAGAIGGAVFGVLMQRIFPRILQSFVPLAIPISFAWLPIFRGVAIGFGICILFALPPLLRFRHVSPLRVLRRVDDALPDRRDWLVRAVYAVIAASVTGFAIAQAETWRQGLIFAGSLGASIGLFALVSKSLVALVRKFSPPGAPFVIRQGLANLYRPQNRTFLLTLSLGMGTFLLLSLYLTRDVLLAQLRSVGVEANANIFLFDIQPDQTAAVAQLVRSLGLPVIQEAPIVTMRLTEIKGRKTSEIRADRDKKIPEWELEREYRSTYRPSLTETEKIVQGRWIGRVDYHPSDTVPISLEQEIARDFSATVGDELVFDVQGIPIRAKIASLRTVDWKRFQTNFFVVFPVGVLEQAPAFHVLVSRVADAAESARLQNAVVAQFPNVSAIDLSSVIQTVDSILTKVALVIRVLSLFTLGTGVIVLASTIWSGRYQRQKESALLRTLGASRAQIWQILTAEYCSLGFLASGTGVLMSIAASWALARFVFRLSYVPALAPLVTAFLAVGALTVLIGLLSSRGAGNAPPLEILRSDSD